MERGQASKARSAFEQAVQRENDWFPHLELALLDAQARQFGPAQQQLATAEALDSDDPVLAEARTVILGRQWKQLDIADVSESDGATTVFRMTLWKARPDGRVAEALAWAGRVFAARGWEHEVWSGADAQLLANVRFYAGYRRAALLEPVRSIEAVLPAGTVLTMAGAEAALRDAGVVEPRPVVLGLLWSGRLRADLQRPLAGDSELEVLW